jgi:hypothetical protein
MQDIKGLSATPLRRLGWNEDKLIGAISFVRRRLDNRSGSY